MVFASPQRGEAARSAGEGASQRVSRWLFLRLLGVVYLVAFVSLAVQMDGLIGEQGILPARRFLDAFAEELGAARFWWLPTLLWFAPSDAGVHALVWVGAALSILLVAGIACAPVLVLLWAFYLSLLTAGQQFLSYQWDILLLETGFLAIFVAPLQLLPSPRREAEPSQAVVWLLRWLLFRLMFSSGAVKLLSGDPTWRDLSALRYHYWTQPLPTWIGWWAHQLPDWFQTLSCAVLFAIELGAPCLIAAPQSWRLVAFFALVSLQLLIGLTGNYCFFNLLSIGLCLMLLDDQVWPAALRRFVGAEKGSGAVSQTKRLPTPGLTWPRWVIAPVAALLIVLSVLRFFDPARAGLGWPQALRQVRRVLSPLCLVNGYGLFAVMTTRRLEIVVEGSDDGGTWREYEFPWKPGDPTRAPAFVEPHQPRLDWQMWFAALGPPSQSPWFANFVYRLLQGSPDVTALLSHNPFPDAPPRQIRAVLCRYTFTDPTERRSTGRWWRREPAGVYFPAVSLESFRESGAE